MTREKELKAVITMDHPRYDRYTSYGNATSNGRNRLASLTYLTIVASLDLSSKWAASTADTIAPSSADKSHTSSVTRNFRARLKKAAGPFDALTAITCLGLMVEEVSPPLRAASSGVEGDVLSDAWSRLAGGFRSCEMPLSSVKLGGVTGCWVGCLSRAFVWGVDVVISDGWFVSGAAMYVDFPSPFSVDMLFESISLPTVTPSSNRTKARAPVSGIGC